MYTTTTSDGLTKELFSTTTSAIPEYHAVTNDKNDAPRDYASQNPSVNPLLNDAPQSAMPGKEYQKSRVPKRAGIGAVIALGLYALLSTACKPPEEMTKILVTPKVNYTAEAVQATGDANYQGNGISNQKPFDVQADLGSTRKGTSQSFNIKLYGDRALRRDFNSSALSGTETIDTDVLDLNNFNLNGFLYYFNNGATDGRPWNNARWNVRNIKVSFNPNRTTGERLPQAYIDGVKQSVLEMQQDSDGFIQSVEFIENGTYKWDSSIPTDGEIQVFHETQEPSSVGNITYPSNGDQVKSAKVFFNPNRAPPGMVDGEVEDAFYQGNQGTGFTTQNELRKWYRFSFHRQAGGSYKIYIDHEQQTGFDDFVTVTQGPSYVFTNTSNGMLGNPMGPGEGFDGAVPRRDVQRTPPRNEDRHERTVKKIEKN
jgi:hypothetical protein